MDIGSQEIAQTSSRVIFKMTQNDRTAGSIPSWQAPKSSKDFIQSSLSFADQSSIYQSNASLAYQNPNDTGINKPFGFSDFIDIVNPLHHIPLVNYAYREMTGDTIRRIGNIVGGAIFGGPVGAASGLVNTVIQEETGKDLGANVLALAKSGEMPRLKQSHAPAPKAQSADLQTWNSPEARQAPLPESAPDLTPTQIADFPAALLAFTAPAYDLDLSPIKHRAPIPQNTARYAHADNGRYNA